MALHAGVPVGARVQHMPLVVLEREGRRHLATGSLHRAATIQHDAVPPEPARLEIPQHQGPTLGVDGDGSLAGPDRATVHIDDIEIGAVAVVGIDLVQGQRADRRRDMRGQPAQGTLLGVLEDLRDGGETDALVGQGRDAVLDAATAGMGVDIERQDLACERGRERGRRRWGWGESMEQRLLGAVAPGVEGGAGNAGGAAEGGDDTVVTGVSEQVAGPLHALGRRARMSMTHAVLPGGWAMLTPQPYHQGVSRPIYSNCKGHLPQEKPCRWGRSLA